MEPSKNVRCPACERTCKVTMPTNFRSTFYTGKPDRQLSRLFLSMMDKMGVRPKSFGDDKQRLEEV